MYVIQLTNDNEPNAPLFLYDEPDCGLLMGTLSISSAKKFYSLNDAMTQFTKLMQEKPHTYPGVNDNAPTIYPPDHLHRGLGLSFANPKGSGTLSIQQLVLQPTIVSEKVEAEIIRQNR